METKAIFIAESSLYLLLKIEQAVVAAVKKYKPLDTEKEFNELVDGAIENYNLFLAEAWNTPTDLKIEILTNFSDLFEYVIDINKKKKAVASMALSPVTTMPLPAGASTPLPVTSATSPKTGKARK